MTDVELSFKAFDPHELLCHFVLQHTGIYQAHGLRVRLVDGTFLPDDVFPAGGFSVACGSALRSWLSGVPVRIVCVAVDRPMFWLYTRGADKELRALKGKQMAGFSPAAPPSCFLDFILRQQGLEPQTITQIPMKDDLMRLGMLLAGEVDSALLSSALAPTVMQRLGLRQLLFFGDSLRFPSTGLAVSQQLLAVQPDLVIRMVRAFRQGLQQLQASPELLRNLLAYFPGYTLADTAEPELALSTYFTADGKVAAACTDQAVALMRAAMPALAMPTGSPYRLDLAAA